MGFRHHVNQKLEFTMRADGAVLKVAKAGPPPAIELIFGHAQWGKYEVWLWDLAGHNPTLVRRGLNNDNIPDKFPISVSAAELEKCQLTWEVTIGALGAKDQQYSLQVIFTQGGKQLTAQPFFYTGPLDAVKVIADFVKFRTV
ncbi:MAG TPA: hypothetical protein VFD27_07955 [Chthoniobacteraceae bacterium]|nr:hypothetical protein [Chthoniobacteraceae bacterium]